MENILGFALALTVGAGGVYFTMNSKIDALSSELDAKIQELIEERNKRPVAYGMLDKINQIGLYAGPVTFSCTYQDGGFPQFKGVYEYHWDFEHSYGVKVPDNYSWDIKEDPANPGVGTITVPPLTQLRPIKIEFSRFDEVNRGGSKRFQRMYADVLPIARKRTRTAGEERLAIDPALWSQSEAALKEIILPLANEARSFADLQPLTDIIVVFENQPASISGSATKFSPNCAVN